MPPVQLCLQASVVVAPGSSSAHRLRTHMRLSQVTPQIALTGIQTNVIFSDLAAVPTPYTISIAGDWIFADNTLRTTVVTNNTDTVVTAIAGGDGLTVEQAIQGLRQALPTTPAVLCCRMLCVCCIIVTMLDVPQQGKVLARSMAD